MDALGVRRPDVMTRVSEYMVEIVDYIQTIMSNKMSYESNGSVHFDTQAFRYKHTRHQHACDTIKTVLQVTNPADASFLFSHVLLGHISMLCTILRTVWFCAGKVGMCMAS